MHWGGVSAVGLLPTFPFLLSKTSSLKGDAAPFRDYNAATNWSFIRTLVINVARMGGYDSRTKAERFLGHDIDKLFSLVE